MTDAFIGEIAFFAFNKLPDGWLPCDGRSLTVQQNAALFALLGSAFGGDSRTIFNLPDLRGRTIVGYGYVPDDHNRVVKSKSYLQMGTAGAGGTETVTLTLQQMPMHTHAFNFSTVNPPASASVANALLSTSQRANSTPTTAPSPPGVYATPGTLVAINPASVTVTGGGAAHENRQPFLAIQACICAQGIFPPRQ